MQAGQSSYETCHADRFGRLQLTGGSLGTTNIGGPRFFRLSGFPSNTLVRQIIGHRPETSWFRRMQRVPMVFVGMVGILGVEGPNMTGGIGKLVIVNLSICHFDGKAARSRMKFLARNIRYSGGGRLLIRSRSGTRAGTLRDVSAPPASAVQKSKVFQIVCVGKGVGGVKHLRDFVW